MWDMLREQVSLSCVRSQEIMASLCQVRFAVGHTQSRRLLVVAMKLVSIVILGRMLKGQCPDYAHARASSVFSSKDNRTVILTRQDFLPDRTADRDLLFIFSSNILDFQRSLSSYIKIWLAVRRLIAILSLAGPPRDPEISFRSL